MIVDEDYVPLSPAEIMALNNEQTIFIVLRADRMDQMKEPTNKNGKFSQIGKRPTGLKTPKRGDR